MAQPFNPTDASARYDLKCDPTKGGAVTQGKAAQLVFSLATVNVKATLQDWYVKVTAIKQTLNALGLPTTNYVNYLAAGGEFYALGRRGIDGESASIAAQTIIDKWVARGLVQSALEAIRTQVFDIAAPVTP